MAAREEEWMCVSVRKLHSWLRYRYALSLKRLWSGLALAVLSTTSLAQFGTPTTPGVSPSGALTLDVPIRIPPGTAGVVPNVSLSYSSQSGNGLAGVGWNLSGLSAIMRCPRTKAVDNYRGGVNLDANDKLCLDGQRLILQAGAYGNAGAVYYTELFNGSRVLQVNDQLMVYGAPRSGTAGTLSYTTGGGMVKIASASATNIGSPNGNVGFRVQTRAGEVMEYAAADINGSVVSRMWLLVRVIDVKGNYWTVDYTKDSVGGEYLPSAIHYTGHDLAPTSSPYNKVQFFYAARPDPTVAYVGGARVSSTQRLTNIKTFSGATEVTDYRLTYTAGTSAATMRSLLASIQECSSSGCQQPVAFTYSGTALQNFPAAGWQGHGGLYWDATRQTYVNNFVGDFNGDGKSDMAAFRNVGAEWHIALSTGSGFTNQIWQGHGGGVQNNFLGDFNGDGKTDLAAHAGGINWHIALSTGSNFTGAYWTAHGGGPQNNFVGDFDGDGRSDLAGYAGGGQWHIALSTGSGFTNAYWLGHGGGQQNNIMGDFNGDGLTDMAGHAGSGQWHMCLSTGSAFACDYWYGHGEGIPAKNFIGDYNGDGKSDMMAFDLGTSRWNVCLSTGKGFTCSLWAGGGSASNSVTADFNGDGRTDAAAYAGSGIWTVCLSRGNGFNCVNLQAHGDGVVNTFIGDYNGDGLSDFSGYTNSGGVWDVRLASAGGFPDQLTALYSSFSAGVGSTGVQTTVTYEPLSTTARYLKEFGATYPRAVVSAPLYVATSLTSDNAAGGTNRVDYWYGTALADYDGRGLLGFNWHESVDQQSGIVSRSTFQQDWPFVGAVATQQTWRPNKTQLLRRSTNNWQAKTLSTQHPSTATSCTAGAIAGAGRPIVLASASSLDESWDIDAASTAMPKTSTINEIDCFGNATRVQIDTNNGDGTFSGFRKVTANVIENWVDSNRWMLNRLKEARVTSTIPTGQPFGATANPAPTVTLTAPATGSVFNALATINLTANAADANGITKVEFYSGSTLLGVDTTAPYSFTWSGANTGTYALKARAYDSLGAFADSATVTVTVNNSPPSGTLTSPPNGASYTLPTAITLQATASDPNNGVNRVQFYRNGGHIGTATTPPYQIAWTETVAGTHAYVAIVLDNSELGAWTNTNYAIFNHPPQATVTISPSPLNRGRSGSGVLSGSVTANVSDGAAPFTFNWVSLGGSFTITNGQTATPTFSSPVQACESEVDSFRVDVTDAVGRVSSATVTARFSATQIPGHMCP